MYAIHWILENKRVYWCKDILSSLPRVGDEIRVSKREFFEVKKIVWCLDEDRIGNYERVNIEISKIKL